MSHEKRADAPVDSPGVAISCYHSPSPKVGYEKQH